MTDQYFPTRVRLLLAIERFLKSNPSISAEGFGWAACKNTQLVKRLRTGGDVSTAIFDKALTYIINFKPE